MAGEVESIASAALRELTGIPGVRRAAIALVEGGGRRLRFRASDADGWCDIDAYDDVPLTAVVRSGEPLLGSLDDLPTRYARLADRQRDEGTRAMAVLPLPGDEEPAGGVVLYFDADQGFDRAQRGALEAVAHRIGESVRRVRAAVRHAAAPAASGSGRLATLHLEDDRRAAGRARHFLRDLLKTWEIGSGLLDTAELCVSELVTNAVIHAGTGSDLTVSLASGTLRVEVRDHGGGAAMAPATDEDPLRVFGRGLQLVGALADRWGSEHDAAGTTAWFTLRIA